jgi:hypothetical protein
MVQPRPVRLDCVASPGAPRGLHALISQAATSGAPQVASPQRDRAMQPQAPEAPRGRPARGFKEGLLGARLGCLPGSLPGLWQGGRSQGTGHFAGVSGMGA